MPHEPMYEQSEQERGRLAAGPREMTRKGWRDVLVRVKREAQQDNMSMIAAGVAFYAFVALFPAMAAFLSLYGLLMDPAQVQQQLSQAAGVLPQSMVELLDAQLTGLVSRADSTLSWAIVISVVLALWSAARGMKALMLAVNISYDEGAAYGFFKLNLLALLFTLGAMALGIVAFALVGVLPAILGLLGLDAVARWSVALLRWPLLAAVVMFALAMIYRYAPNRTRPRWRWTSPGAVIATVIWLIASILFSLYVSRFGSYDKTYGAFAGVVILLLWLYVSCYIVLLGAQLNAELEHQTRRDTTVGREKPMGERRAQMADTLGERTTR
jgi:membrane protein